MVRTILALSIPPSLPQRSAATALRQIVTSETRSGHLRVGLAAPDQSRCAKSRQCRSPECRAASTSREHARALAVVSARQVAATLGDAERIERGRSARTPWRLQPGVACAVESPGWPSAVTLLSSDEPARFVALHADMRVIGRRFGGREQDQACIQPCRFVGAPNQLTSDSLSLDCLVNR